MGIRKCIVSEYIMHLFDSLHVTNKCSVLNGVVDQLSKMSAMFFPDDYRFNYIFIYCLLFMTGCSRDFRYRSREL